MQAQRAKKELDMTARPLLGKIFLFSLPIMLTGILQLLYNASDIIVLGRFASDVSAGAVGSTGSLINLTVNLFMGLSVGACTAAARWIGAGNEQRLDRVVHTAILLSLIGGVIVGVIGVCFSRYFLIAMDVPQDSVLPLSTTYLQIYFAGMPFNLLYNFGSSLCRARGDSRTPLFFLCAAGVSNVGLNIFFVAVCRMDVAGVALGTIIAQLISSTLVLTHLCRLKGHCHVNLRKLRIYKDALGDIVRIGLPAGVQGCIFSLSNVVIQSSINSFGDVAITANAEAANIEGFVYTSMNAVSQACLTFTGQNYGAHKRKNIDVTFFDSLFIVTLLGLVVGLGVYFSGSFLMSIYTKSDEVIRMGLERMSVICSVYFLCGIMEVLVGSMRGMGHSVVPMLVSIVGVCGVRIVYIYTFFAAYRTLFNLYLSYPISWLATILAHAVCLIFVRRKEYKKLALLPPVPSVSVEEGSLPAESSLPADGSLLETSSSELSPASSVSVEDGTLPAGDPLPSFSPFEDAVEDAAPRSGDQTATNSEKTEN